MNMNCQVLFSLKNTKLCHNICNLLQLSLALCGLRAVLTSLNFVYSDIQENMIFYEMSADRWDGMMHDRRFFSQTVVKTQNFHPEII